MRRAHVTGAEEPTGVRSLCCIGPSSPPFFVCPLSPELKRDLKKLKMIYNWVRRQVGEPTNTEPVVVYISGCWDLFHIGHLNIIEAAAALGDYLVLGVVTDEGMRSYGKQPIIPYEYRRAIVAALKCVDAVVEYHSLGDISSVVSYGAHIRVVGPECGTFEAQREARVALEDLGVKYVVLPRTPGVSTTLIKQACHQALGTGGFSDAADE